MTRTRTHRRRGLLGGIAACSAALAIGAGLAYVLPAAESAGHPRAAAVPVAHVRSSTPCPSAAVLEAAWDAAHVEAATGVLQVVCDDEWAAAGVTTGADATTGLFRLVDGRWNWTDRLTPCSTRQVPAALEAAVCPAG